MKPALLFVALAALLPGRARAADDHPLGRAQELLAEVAPHVEKACGAAFPAPPRVVALSEASAQSVFAEDMRPEFERRYAALPKAQREGLLRLAAQTSVRSCLARYSFGTHNVIVVREGFDTQCAALAVEGERAEQLLRVSLAHECVHALDDARFGLAKLYRGAADDEALRAVAMVSEGRAVHFGRIAATAAGAPADLVALLPGGESPKTEREWHVNLTYRLGAEFVGALVARGGLALADKAAANPPAATWWITVPARWPDSVPDERPARAMARAGLAETTKPLSELQLVERYAAMKGLAAARALFASHRGGAQSLVGGTNAAVLAFADEEAAKRYEEVSREEAGTVRRGTLVARALGSGAEQQEDVLAKLAAALADVSGEPERKTR